MMFKSTRRFEGDSREWVPNNDLNDQFNNIFSDADFYAIKHWLYCCGSTPNFQTFMEKDWLEEYITNTVRAGDLLEIWAITSDRMSYVSGKMPDDRGLVPVKGAY